MPLRLPWTEEEIDYLVKNYNTKGVNHCCEVLKKTRPAVHHKAMRMGANFNRNKPYFDIPSKFFWQLERNARTRNIPVNITLADVWALFLKQERKCALTGWDLILQPKGEVTASLDRIDSLKPYDLDNIQWVHKDVNLSKMDFSEERFVEICRAVVEKVEKDAR